MISRLQAVWVTVEDLERSVRFYSTLLDSQPAARLKGKGPNADQTVCFELSDATRLMLWHEPAVATALAEMKNPARVDVDLEVDDVQALFERLVRSGIDPLTDLTEHELGGRTFDVQDPDGNRVRLGNRWATPLAKA